MNSGPSATFGIMFSVTNSGSSNRLTSGDQVNITASMTPTRAPRQKPPRISAAVTARLESQAYLAEVSVASGRERRGQDEFRHCEGIDQHLPEHDHGKVHDQDDRQRSRRSSSIAEQDMLPELDRGRFPARARRQSIAACTIFQPVG